VLVLIILTAAVTYSMPKLPENYPNQLMTKRSTTRASAIEKGEIIMKKMHSPVYDPDWILENIGR
jgi:hypothetical protein